VCASVRLTIFPVSVLKMKNSNEIAYPIIPI
jgi:hypothetical protein